MSLIRKNSNLIGFDQGVSVKTFDKVFQQGYDQALQDLKENLKDINEINDTISDSLEK